MGSARAWSWVPFLAIGLAIAMTITGCAADDDDAAPTPTPTPTPEPTPTPTPTEPEPDDIAIELSTDASVYQVGDEIQFTITATNTSGAQIELEFPTGQRFDIEVTRDDEVVWRWSDDRVFTQAIEHEELEDGESLIYEATWDQLDRDDEPVEPGIHSARAVITATGTNVEATVEFEIEE